MSWGSHPPPSIHVARKPFPSRRYLASPFPCLRHSLVWQVQKEQKWRPASLQSMLLVPILFSFYFYRVEAEVKLVQAIFRHGDRAASGRYPTDPNFEDSWPRGYSQLTDRGYDQAVELGNFFKSRYPALLSKSYNRRDLWIRSSDKDRCIETAMGVAAGLYPDARIPIHTYSNHWEDLLLKPNSVPCARADQEERRDKALLHRRLNQEFEDFFLFLTEKTGMIVDMSNAKDLYNTLFREVSNGLPQPSWVWQRLSNNRTVFDQIVELKRLDRMESFNSFEKSRLRTGFLVHRLLKNIEDTLTGVNTKKMYLYSSHDATLTSLMYSLGVSDDQLPPYASALILELHEKDGNNFVKLFYRRSPANPPEELRLPGCSVSCPLDDFRTFTSSRTVASKEDHKVECGTVAPVTAIKEENMLINTIGSVMVLLMEENLHSLVSPKGTA